MMKRGCLALLLSTACGSNSYADQPVAPQPPGPRIALAIAGDKVRAPYDVQLIRENGDSLPTYAMKDRFYVQGSAGARCTRRGTHPPGRRRPAGGPVQSPAVRDGDE